MDYKKDLSILENQGMEVLYKKNEKNDIATLSFRFDKGSDDDPLLEMAAEYLPYLGTPTRSAEEIATAMYDLACNFGFRVGGNTSNLFVSGLDENLGAALDIVEDLVRNAVANEEILSELKSDLIRSRLDAKMNQRACNSALQRYLTYGGDYIAKKTLSNEAVAALSSDAILDAVKGLADCAHTILYYGPSAETSVSALLNEHHKVPADPVKLVKSYPAKLLTPEKQVLIAQYDARQFNYVQYSDRGEKLELAQDPLIELFNEYYGGGMNAIVFQEMRESRALAYGAGAWLSTPAFKDDTYSFRAYIASQNDKLRQAVEAFDQIINELPVAPENLEIAKTSILSKLRTQRTIGESVLYSYLNARELGLEEPLEKQLYEKVGSLTMDDLKATHERWIKDRTYVYAILGDTHDLDMQFLRSLGPVKMLTLEEIFGY